MEPDRYTGNTQSSHYLISHSSHRVAQIKYKIREQETALKRCLTPEPQIVDLRRSRELVRTLSDLYEALSRLHMSCLGEVIYEDPKTTFSTWDECYSSIVILTHELKAAETLYLATMFIAKLSNHYKILNTLLSIENPEKTVSSCDPPSKLTRNSSPKEWLLSLVERVNQTNIDFSSTHLELLSHQDFMAINNDSHMIQPEYLELAAAVYFYKMFPEKLHIKSISLDELVAVRTKLAILYQLIEEYHEHFAQKIKAQEGALICDILFHGDDLPQGVELNVTTTFDNLIVQAVRELNLNVDMNFLMNTDPEDLLRAYKFRFKPIRLIDITMCLLMEDGNIPGGSSEHNHATLFREMTTSNCLDLYGYFSNKETYYFLQILLMAHAVEKPSWLRVLNDLERDAIQRVFNALTKVMKILRDELTLRKITTEPYDFEPPVAEKINPRGRHHDALKWVTSVYIESPGVDKTNTIDELFSQLS